MRIFTKSTFFTLAAACLAPLAFLCKTDAAPAAASSAPINVSVRTRSADNKPADKVEKWVPTETAIIICDMWDKHWCKHATARVGEMAPALNNVITKAREKGVQIVHAPSDICHWWYGAGPGSPNTKKYRGRMEALKFNRGNPRWHNQGLPTEAGAKPPPNDGQGCASCRGPRGGWSHQIDTIIIKDEESGSNKGNDIISENGSEIMGYFRAKGIKNVILTGVHTNMCVIGRPFGLRAMKAAGFNTVLMRDMTDLMYNNEPGSKRGAPHVDHWAGLQLWTEYIERHVTPTIPSTVFTGKAEFRFKEEKGQRK